MTRRFGLLFVFLTSLCVIGCGGGPGGEGGSGANGFGGSAGATPLPEIGSADRADLSYADNLLQKVADGEWTLGEGIVQTLQAFAGEREEASVLRHAELNTYEGTGVFWLAREYVEDGPDEAARAEIARLLDLFTFSVADLEEMAGVAPGGSQLATKGASVNCMKFFEDFMNPPTGVTICLEVESVTINNKQYRVFFPAESLPSAGWGDTHISQTINALSDSIPVYEGMGDVPSIDIVFSVRDGGKLWGQSFPDREGHCFISIYTNLQSQPQERFQQLLAHEIAHCFQGETWPAQHAPKYDLIKWHFEGGAEYWSNLVYPEVNLEWRHREKLQRTELFSQFHKRSYENFIFFQYLGSTIGNDGIVQLMDGLPDFPGSNIVDQREATADFPDMERVFHEFVQALTDNSVQDTGGLLIPYAAEAIEVDIGSAAAGVISEQLLVPFVTYRYQLVADKDEQGDLEFRETGSMTSSGRFATAGVDSGQAGTVVESLVDRTGARPWNFMLPTEVPEEDCESGRHMIVATTTKSPTQGSGGPTGATFELDVTDIDDAICCLHGTWVMNNQDLANADAPVLGPGTTYSGLLTADYRSDATVLFSWGGFTRVFDDTNGPVTSVLNGAGTQFYEVGSSSVLLYSGPELTVNVMETAPFDQQTSFTAVLDTALGDSQTSQFFECNDTELVTIIRGDDRIRWSRMN